MSHEREIPNDEALVEPLERFCDLVADLGGPEVMRAAWS